ncbi:hypothetical protein MKX03_019800 [Papaver bracteatum]|nr:hypothetical protein MKX03_019800 [Papaver bracteatum]
MASKSSASPMSVGLLFALVVLYANLEMASAVGLSCGGLALNITILRCPADHCYSVCKGRCPEDKKVHAYACVIGLLGVSTGCSCCYIHI